jgi:capsular polysaccharide biosynthesis protein
MPSLPANLTDLRLGDAFGYFGSPAKATFASGAPRDLGSGIDASLRVLLPATGQSVPTMVMVDAMAEPPAIAPIPLEPHLVYPLYMIGLAGGLLLDEAGHVADRHGHVFIESFRDASFLGARVYRDHDLRSDTYRTALASAAAEPVRMEGRYLSLVYAVGAENWYHWLVENLGRLATAAVIDRFAEVRLILPRRVSQTQRDSLAALGIGPERTVIHDGRVWQCDELYLPSFGAVRGSVRPEPLQWLRPLLQAGLGLDPAGSGGGRLYVSRRDARWRRLVNEDEIVPELLRLGFEVVSLDGRSLAEQAVLFHDAAVIVAPHGAGLANILFSRPGTLLIELLAERAGGSLLRVYHTLAAQLGIRYLGVKAGSELADGDFRLAPGVLGALLPELL